MLRKKISEFGMPWILSLFYFLFIGTARSEKYDENDAKIYLQKINADLQVKTTESVLASWAYESNITDENLKHQLEVSAELANFSKEIWKETIKYPWKTFKDPDLKRQFQKFSVLGTAILTSEKYEKYNKIVSDMQSVYGKAKVCNYNNRTDCSLALEPELTEIFANSRDPDELRYYWEEWRNAAGRPVREMFKEYVKLSNEASRLNNFSSSTDFWLRDYEAEDFKEQVEALWEQVKPLYVQLHAYVRRRLREQFGEEHVSKRGPIPAHLLGNMWAQTWGNIYNYTVPYPGKSNLDVSENMIQQGYTPLKMFKLAEEFFTSLGLSPMPETFWNNSILEKPKDGRDLICHASAWDFYDGKDFRIKQCTRVTFRQLVTVHHEMGHIQYYIQYKNQPKIYRRGANPGFHEAIGDVMALSVSTPKHLKKIGLLNETENDTESEINQLYHMALDKIAFLPFGYLMDQWRWSVFDGKTTDKDFNCKWWQLREKYQGLSPSVFRTEKDFDAGAKYHIVANVPYIRYFVSFVIQFQFHRSLCIAAKEFDPNNPSLKPLHQCDIYQSKEAGLLLKKMLSMGSSKSWPEAMEVMTGQRKMDASAILDYFSTLTTWLENENKRTGEYIGWDSGEKVNKQQMKRSDSPASLVMDTKGLGNLVEDNLAYPYAEFVHQDNNIFGVDYLEEVDPTYHSLTTILNKKLPKKYYLPASNSIKFSDRSDFQLSQKLPGFDSKGYLEIPNIHGKKKVESRKCKKEKGKKENEGNRQTIYIHKDNMNEPFIIRSKSHTLERCKILNAIMKSIQSPSKKSDCKTDREKRNGVTRRQAEFKAISFRNRKKSKKTSGLECETEKECQEKKKRQIPIIPLNSKRIQIILPFGEKELVLQMRDSSHAPGPTINLIQEKNLRPEKKEEPTTFSLISEDKENRETQLNRDTEPEVNKKQAIENLDRELRNDLILKSELVKNEAEKVLRTFKMPVCDLLGKGNVKKWNPSCSKEVPDPECLRNGGNLLVKILRTGTNAEAISTIKKLDSKPDNVIKNSKLHLQKLDLINIISVNNVGKRFPANRKPFLREKKRQIDPDLTFLDREPPKKYKVNARKSYKEFHNARTPVLYNSVIISSGKSEKPEEGKSP